MLRRNLIACLAVVALGFLVASPAQAGATAGAVGVKKTANVKLQNVGAIATYVVIVPQGLPTPITVADAKRLGAVLLAPSSRAIFYPVPSAETRLRQMAHPSTGFGSGNLARSNLYYSCATFTLLGRAVHCNVGRPALWVFPPSA